MRLLLTLFTYLVLMLPVLTWSSVVPKFRDNRIDINDLAQMASNKHLIIFHPSQKLSLSVGKGRKSTFDVRFVTAMTVIDEPVYQVREVVTDFSHYHEFMPQNEKSTVISKSKNQVIQELKLSLKVPLIPISFKLTLDYFLAPDGDITWSRIKGDIKGNVGRFEFFELSPNRTLLVLTYWTELQGAGLLIRLLLRLQPDMELAIPISSCSLLIEAIKNRCELISHQKPADPKTLPSKPVIPMMTKSQLPIDTLQLLSRIGTLVFVHPIQWIRSEKNKPIDVRFVTSAARIQGPQKALKPLMTDFSRYPEFMSQVVYARQEQTANGMQVDWRLKFGFAMFRFNLNFLLDYAWHDDTILLYRCKSGNIKRSYGCWEWLSLSDNQTMIFFSAAIPYDRKVPFILKFTQIVPNSQVVMGASSTVVTIEKVIPWVEDQVLEVMHLYR